MIQLHLNNLNCIFADLGMTHPFQSKPDSQPSNPKDLLTFFGRPDFHVILKSEILSFVEVKTPNDLPVKDNCTLELFDLLEMYEEDLEFRENNQRNRGDIGRTAVKTVIEQVYGYLA